MKNNEVIVYWCPFVRNDGYDWNMFYPEPKTLYSELLSEKEKNSGVGNYFMCSAFKERAKNIFTLNTIINSTFTLVDGVLVSGDGMEALIRRGPQLKDKASVTLGMSYGFFSEEPLTMHLNPPFLHKSQYTEKTTLFSAGLDISKWFRAINIEVAVNINDTVEILENSPLAYVEFITNKKVVLKRFEINDKIRNIGAACALSVTVKRAIPLYERYKLFMESKQNKILLKEIKKNLVEE
jgi:hypothetical protein